MKIPVLPGEAPGQPYPGYAMAASGRGRYGAGAGIPSPTILHENRYGKPKKSVKKCIIKSRKSTKRNETLTRGYVNGIAFAFYFFVGIFKYTVEIFEQLTKFGGVHFHWLGQPLADNIGSKVEYTPCAENL